MENLILSLILAQLILLPIARKWELDLNKVIMGGLGVGLLTGIATQILFSFYPATLYLRLPAIIALIIAISVP